MPYVHQSVMLEEILKYLQAKSGQIFVDCTLGGAGYTLALAEKVGPNGKILGIDLDDLALRNAAEQIANRKLNNIVLVQNNFKNLKTVVDDNFPVGIKIQGIVFDLGLSSAQLDDEARGFSFKGDRPLDMAFGETTKNSTAAIVNNYSLPELTRIFRVYGEEKQAYRIAKAIIARRREKRIKTTADLVAIIEEVSPFRFYSKIHPATRIFQALRMETNEELKSLEEVLPVALDLLAPKGRIVVVSFHSGEDRIVKRFFRNASDLGKVKLLTKKPLIPSEVETSSNSRARSAKLRAAEKI